jgi:UDP-N-acetyl-D-glucosamine dehydrogenase
VPIDPYYLTWVAERAGAQTRFVELAGEINRAMPAYVVDRCAAALAAESRALAGSRVLVLGLAYKPNVADVRESPSFELIELLRQRGADVSYHDPHVPRPWPGRRHDLRMESVPWAAETLRSADLVLIATDHDWYDWDFVGAHARLIVDSRNAMARAKGPIPARIVKA